MARRRSRGKTSLRLEPADPFELIRWLARSQSDPRKATAELVQNSLDAGAAHVDIHRQRVRGRVCLIVRDDGAGVLPEMEREEALRYLATHVGHSRKLGLSPAERARVVGKYGVGLLGFWAIGHELELRTRVGGSSIFALRLFEDSPNADIVQLPPTVDALATYTEAVVADVHEGALAALGGRRLCDYLAAELRGQLLAREVSLVVHDHVARGLAQKRFEVVPRRFSGEPLTLPAEVEVPGFGAIRVELHLARGAQRPGIAVECAGTLVADDLGELAALGLGTAPWVGRDLSGLVDFPDFSVPPGTRRGVLPDRAALAFVEAMQRLEPLVVAELDRMDAERRAALDRDVLKELRRALRGLHRRLPQYDLPRVADGGVRAGAVDEGEPVGGGTPRANGTPVTRELFPPGPLVGVRIAPAVVEVTPGGERRVRAVAVDRDGRAVEGATFAWSVEDPRALGLAVQPEGPRPAVSARADAPVGGTGAVRVEARHEDRSAVAEAPVTIVEPAEDGATLGIPEPHLVSDPDGAWRTRMAGERWEVNDAHEDYRSLRGDPRGRVRYLLTLLSREIVLRTRGRATDAEPLDALIEILAHAERNLRGQ